MDIVIYWIVIILPLYVSPSKSHKNFIGYSDIIIAYSDNSCTDYTKIFDFQPYLAPIISYFIYKYRYQLNSIRNLIILMKIYVMTMYTVIYLM